MQFKSEFCTAGTHWAPDKQPRGVLPSDNSCISLQLILYTWYPTRLAARSHMVPFNTDFEALAGQSKGKWEIQILQRTS